MNIGIFSKFEMCGGSEYRGCELANGLCSYSDYNVTLLTRGNRMPDRLREYLNPLVSLVEDSLSVPDRFYQQDCILVINTDSKDFTRCDFWDGKSPFGANVVDLARIKKMVFLFNFLVSPSRYLYEIKARGPEVGVITTNSKFFEEITKQDRYETIRTYPRTRLESPIAPESVLTTKTQSDGRIRVGMHSKGLGNKWNEDLVYVVKKINERYKDANPFYFHFMGMSGDRRKEFEKLKISNVHVMRENEMTVRDFLASTDIFMFMPSWKREEPWARVVAEAMMSGCCIIATNRGGNKDQVVNGHNGFLCGRKDDFFNKLCYLNEHREFIDSMGRNSNRIAMTGFRTEIIVNRLIAFIESF